MTTPTATTAVTATAHLAVIHDHWYDLADALAVPAVIGFPPAGLANYVRQLADAERAQEQREQTAAERHAERIEQLANGAPGESPMPLSATVYDTMRAVEGALVELADVTAAAVQRTSMTHAPLNWARADRDRRNALADRDALDPRRWRYHGTRTARQAADWLGDRLAGVPGPFVRLTLEQQARIATVAASCAARIERTLGILQRSAPLDRECPHCRGPLRLRGGDGQPPSVQCADCGRTWTEQLAAALPPR